MRKHVFKLFFYHTVQPSQNVFFPNFRILLSKSFLTNGRNGVTTAPNTVSPTPDPFLRLNPNIELLKAHPMIPSIVIFSSPLSNFLIVSRAALSALCALSPSSTIFVISGFVSFSTLKPGVSIVFAKTQCVRIGVWCS